MRLRRARLCSGAVLLLACIYLAIGCSSEDTAAPSQTVSLPDFTPVPGVFTASQQVSMSCETPGATIRYTTDGTDPNESSPAFTGAVAITSSTTLQARAWKSGWTTSGLRTGIYTITGTVAQPTFTPQPGSFPAPQQVTITCSTEGASIHYTTDGTTPTQSSSTYSGPISVANSMTIRAGAWKDGWTPSLLAVGGYVITFEVLTHLTSLTTGGSSCGVAVRDGYAFVAGNPGLEIYDCTDPANAFKIGQVAFTGSSYYGDVELKGSAAYVGRGMSNVEVVDVSALAGPVRVESYNTRGAVHGLALDGDLLAVASDDSLIFLNVTSNLHPVRVGAVATNQDGLGQGNYGVALDPVRSLAFLSSFNNGAEVVDYSNPSRPTLIATYPATSNPLNAWLDPAHSTAVIATDDGIEIVDYTRPNSPQFVASFEPGGNGGRGVIVIGTNAIFASSFNGLYVIDIANPQQMRSVQRFAGTLFGSPHDVKVEGNHVFVVADSRLAIFNYNQ